MRILALDMATTTGWASGESDGQWKISKSGIFVYMNGKHPYPLPKRLLMFRGDLNLMINELGIEVLLYEVAHHRGGPATRSGIGMETVLIMTGYERGILTHGVHSASLKKFATGDGRAEKAAMIVAANRTSHKMITDDNEADAYNLLNWGRTYVEVSKTGKTQIKLQSVGTQRTIRKKRVTTTKEIQTP